MADDKEIETNQEEPNYVSLFGNEVFSKEFKYSTKEGETIDLYKVILLSRYTEPHEEAVLEYLKKLAIENIGSLKLVSVTGEILSSNGKGGLEKAIMELPERFINDLATLGNGIEDFIRSSTPAKRLKEGEKPKEFVSAKYGIIPVKIVNDNQERGYITGASWFDKAFSNDKLTEAGMGERFSIKIALEEGNLPYSKDRVIDVLNSGIVIGDSGTPEILIGRTPSFADEGKEVVELIYKNFSTQEQIESLTDQSEGSLKEACVNPIVMLIKMNKHLEEQKKEKEEAVKQAMAAAEAQGGNSSEVRKLILGN